MAALAGAAFNSKHSRGPGGLFAATSAANGKPAGAWAHGPIQSGAAHGKATDPRVKALQAKLNALGITDEHGRPLLVDGKPGAHTSAAIKKMQEQLGLKPDGVVTAALMVKILTAQPPAKKAAGRMAAPKRHTSSGRKASTSKKPAGPAKPAMTYATGTRTRAKAI